MMAGKRDGSVLAVFDAAPMPMLASNPDQLSQPGLELLGVAHRGCADLARQRLEGRQVKLPDDLPQLVAGEGAVELPALHRPPAPGRCAFCLELATWVVKTALMLDLSGGQPLIPTGFHHDFQLQRSPLPSQIVWIGAYRDSTHAAWARHDGLHVGISADEPPNAFSTTFDGIASTVEQARAAAGGKDVHVAGGAATVQRALNAGLVDALQLHLASVLLGARVRLFRGAGR